MGSSTGLRTLAAATMAGIVGLIADTVAGRPFSTLFVSMSLFMWVVSWPVLTGRSGKGPRAGETRPFLAALLVVLTLFGWFGLRNP